MDQLQNDANASVSPMETSPAARGIALDAFVPYLLNQVTNRLNRRMQNHLRNYRVSVPQWRVLCLLTVHGPQSIGTIANNTVIAQSTLSRVVDQLERRALVERRLRPNNNRVVEVHLTKEGRAIFQRILPAALSVRDELIDALSEAEQRQLTHILSKLFQSLQGKVSAHA